jgi:hypothetical protein
MSSLRVMYIFSLKVSQVKLLFLNYTVLQLILTLVYNSIIRTAKMEVIIIINISFINNLNEFLS